MSKARKLPRITQYMQGPEAGGIRYCIRCSGLIQPGQLWLKDWAPGCEYATGTHVTCAVRSDRHIRECGLCGQLTRGESEAAQHLAASHRVVYPVTL